MSETLFYSQSPLSLNKIEETFKASFGLNFDKEYWSWRFLENPNHEKVYISYIMDGDVLAAYYAVSPMVMLNGGKECLVALSNMTMTHPDYRGRGFFKRLALDLYQELRKDGFIGVYGFANHNSHYGFRMHLNWHDIAAVSIFSVTKSEYRNPKAPMGLSFSISALSTEDIAIFSNYSYKEPKAISISRNRKNLLWRFNQNKTNQYFSLMIFDENQPIGGIVFKDYEGGVDIMEVFSKNENVKTRLLLEGVSYLLQNKYKRINLWSNLHTEEHLLLEKHGFKEGVFNSYFGYIPFNDDPALLDIKNWHYRFMDSDIF